MLNTSSRPLWTYEGEEGDGGGDLGDEDLYDEEFDDDEDDDPEDDED